MRGPLYGTICAGHTNLGMQSFTMAAKIRFGNLFVHVGGSAQFELSIAGVALHMDVYGVVEGP